MIGEMQPLPFASGAAFRRWLAANQGRATEVRILFFKKKSGKGGITYPEALDEALCFGWIDGVRARRDDASYTIRFTPRRPNSTWSLVNVRRAEHLLRQGQMEPAGKAAFAARTSKRTGIYSFENRPQRLPAALERQFRDNKPAWVFFRAQPAGYQRTIIWWVVSGKQEMTRQRRLTHLMAQSAAGRRLDLMKPYNGSEMRGKGPRDGSLP